MSDFFQLMAAYGPNHQDTKDAKVHKGIIG